MLEIEFSPLKWDTIFFFGEYERPLSKAVSAIIEPGDVCLDVGANFGWYTTLLSTIVGSGGQVHAFEPVPPTFAELQKNVGMLGDASNVTLNNLALGDASKEVSIGFLQSEGSGFASIATSRSDSMRFECRMVSISEYVADHLDGREVTFLKADIEGSEMMMFLGAERLFQQKRLPILLVEMAADRGVHFGYTPNDLLDFISARGDYRFLVFDGLSSRIREMVRFAPGHMGENVLCIPKFGYEDRVKAVEQIFDWGPAA